METTIPQVATVIPKLAAALHTLMARRERGEWQTWAEAHTAVMEAFTPAVMAEVEAHIPGWQEMASYDNGQTLVHVCSVFVALLSSNYYQQGTARQRWLWEWAVLLHDLAKVAQKGKRDFTHPFRSAAMAARILPTAGFPVQPPYARIVDRWVELVETAVLPTEPDPISDNRQLPPILEGIGQMAGPETELALVLKTILLHQSFSPLLDWPNPTPLTEAEIKTFISPSLWPLLGPFLAFDSVAWDMYGDIETEQLHAKLIEICIGQVQQLLQVAGGDGTSIISGNQQTL